MGYLFRQYIKSKPDRKKTLTACWCQHILCSQYWALYAGKQSGGPYQFSNAAEDIVKRLIKPISWTGRNLTIHNWDNVPLLDDLAKNHTISVVGTMCKNNKDIPYYFTENGRLNFQVN